MFPTGEPHLHTLAELVAGQIDPGDIHEKAWEKIIPAALRHGLGPMLYARVKNAGLESLPGEISDPLRGSYFRAAAVYLELVKAAIKAEAAFQASAIETIWLKGMALANTLYPDPALRPMADLDVLVPFGRREAALEAAEAAGFSTYEDVSRLFGTGDEMGTSHHYHLRDRTNEIAVLEIHFELLSRGRELLPRENHRLFWEQMETLEINNLEFTILKPEENLLYLCAHTALQHGEAEFDLLRYFDMHLVVTETEIDWDRLVGQARELAWSYPVERCLRICKGYFHTPIPEEAFGRLAEGNGDDAVRRRARLLQNPVREWEGLLGQLGELPEGKRSRMVLALIFPGLDYMRRRYALSLKWQAWFYYPYRWADMGVKLGRVWWARRRARVTGQ